MNLRATRGAPSSTPSSGEQILMRICEIRDSDGNVSCPASAVSGIAFNGGLVTIETALNPNTQTRWLYLDIRIPDRTALGASAVIGYRVCRGAC
jgi:hypothetical protein